ncbi:MAG: rhomboid family intramembrane serine protease [Ignavibacteria bacterium]|nr:rhomboid family intramembrane serine protease [Ignavibacteria bacterium]
MIPLRDTIKSRTVPYVNYLLIGVSVLVFFLELSLGPRINAFVNTYGVIPARVGAAVFEGHVSLGALLPLFTSIFLHGGWMHLIGNMLYLYIFGDNVEDRLGHGAYLLFYLLAGIGAAIVEVYFQQNSVVPLVGASGAIAGVLGAYFILYPRARVLTLVPLLFLFPVVEVSAFFFLGFWFVMQFFQGTMSYGSDAASGGVAWWAHTGGFVAGAVMLPIFLIIKRR